MLVSCIVKGCLSIQKPNNNDNNPKIVFYQLPWNNIQLRTEWVKLAGYNPYNADDVKHITKDHTICSLHFTSCSKRGVGKQHMVPSLNLPKGVTEKRLRTILPSTLRPNIRSRPSRQKTKIGNISTSLRNPANKKRQTSRQQISPVEDSMGRSPKRVTKELHSNRCILEEELSITQRSGVKPSPINSTNSTESPPRPVSIQAPFATYNPPISHIIPPLPKRVLIVSNHQHSVMANLYSLWKADKLCDANISNGTESVKIHKMVLCAMCPKILSVFADESSNTLPNVTFPATTSKEALIAFTEYLYNGVLDLDTEILEHLKTIALMLDMEELQKLCDDQLRLASINNGSCNGRLELVPVDVKQEICSSDNAEDLNFDLGVVVDECDFSIKNDGDVKKENIDHNIQIKIERDDVEEPNCVSAAFNSAANNDVFLPDFSIKNGCDVKKEMVDHNIQIKIERDDVEESKCTSTAFHSSSNNDVFLPDFSGHDRNFSLVPPSDLQPNVSAAYLPPLSFPNVSESLMRPVGYITPTSEQRLITREMLNLCEKRA